MPIEEAEKIAQSQVAWAILFILLFFIRLVRNLVHFIIDDGTN
ncbi:Uncharacterised protein [Streptococcus pneumoniae]|nr:Uncharacterised protein [Streptococcus pneumoniae]